MIRNVIIHILKSVKRVSVKFYKDSCLVRASGLAYSTLLAMVPFITIVFAFGGFDTLGKTIETALLKTIMPTHHEAFSQAINAFTRNSLATGTFGMIFFLLTSIFLINTVARNFDFIWGINIKTNFFRRYATYTAILVFGSLLLGVSTSLTESIEAYIISRGLGEVEEYRKTFSFIIPYLLTLFIFFLMLIIIPSIRVKVRAAVFGAIISSILFEGVKILFRLWVLNSVRTSLIYGSLAIIPVFLIGLYLFWIIVLIGTEISYFVQHEKDPIAGNPELFNVEEKIAIGLSLFISVAKSFIDGNGGVTKRELESDIKQSPLVIDYFTNLFVINNLLLNVDNKGRGYIPAKSLNNVFAKDIVLSIYGEESRLSEVNDIALRNSRVFSCGGYSALDDRSIYDLIKQESFNEKNKNTKI